MQCSNARSPVISACLSEVNRRVLSAKLALIFSITSESSLVFLTFTLVLAILLHLGSGRALKKWGKTLDFVSCFPLHFFLALPLPACFTTEQSTVESFLFVKCDMQAEVCSYFMHVYVIRSVYYLSVRVYSSRKSKIGFLNLKTDFAFLS